jgi:hypothetical protein
MSLLYRVDYHRDLRQLFQLDRQNLVVYVIWNVNDLLDSCR